MRTALESIDRFRTVAFGHEVMRAAIVRWPSWAPIQRIEASEWGAVVPTCYREAVARCVALVVEKHRGKKLSDELVCEIVEDLHREIWRSVEPVDPSTPLEF